MKLRKNNSLIISILLVAGLFLSLSSVVFAAEELSGNEILVKVDEQSEMVAQGEMLSILTFENVNADGTENSYKFAALARQKPDEPNRTLVYYLKPDQVRGSIFLSSDTSDGETRMWLYLSALGQAKELSASRKESSFAGSTLSFEEITSWSMSEEYNAEILEEATKEIGGESVPAYKLELTEKEGAEPQFPKQIIWVGKDNWVLLQSKNFNEDGELQKEMEVKELTTFEGNTVTKKLITTIPDTGASTTVTYEKRERPDQDIPDSVFDSESLKDFSPEKWGMIE